MQIREKIIIGMAGAAMLYFVIDALAVSELGSTDTSSDLNRECEEFIARGKDALNTLKSSPELFRRIALLEGDDDARNPFIRNWHKSNGSGGVENAKPAERSWIRYTGYFESAHMCMVVINGKEYSVNDVIYGTDLVIKSICKESVTLQEQDSGGVECGELITILKEVENDVVSL